MSYSEQNPIASDSKAGLVLFNIVMVITTVTFAYIAVLSIWLTICFYPDPLAEVVTSVTWLTAPSLMISGLISLVLISLLIYLMCRLANRLNERLVLAVIILVTSVLSCAMVLLLHSEGHVFSDAHSLIEYASRASSSDWSSFLPSAEYEAFAQDVPSAYAYFSFYPYQIGGFLYFFLIFKLFGSGNVLALELINVAANELALAALTLIVWETTHLKTERVVAPVIIGLNAPFFILATFPYGNTVGFSLTCLYLLFQVISWNAINRKRMITFQLLSVIPLSVGLAIKPTYKVIALGMVAAWLILAIRRHKWLGSCISVLVLALSFSLSGLPKTYFEHVTGVDYGNGLPTVTWLEIGLTESEGINSQPGWWDGYALGVWNETQQNTEATKEIISKQLVDELGDYVENPLSLVSFLSRKLESEWAEPTYQSIMYLGYNKSSDGSQIDIRPLYTSLPLSFLDGYQSFVYIGAALEAVRLLKEQKSKSHSGDIAFMLCCTVMAGFACYMLWEAKSVYILPFVTLMTPLSASGFIWAFCDAKCYSTLEDERTPRHFRNNPTSA